ncbi:MAG: DUF402 domain-containing protein [Anaerolineaceae bacterium]
MIKFNSEGQQMLAYEAHLLAEDNGMRVLEAWFAFPSRLVDQVWLERGDRFVEKYFSNHWYNIYSIYNQSSDQIKAWYCNICLPALFTSTEVRWVDLALDVLIYPNGSLALLDQDEFALLNLNEATRRRCWLAVIEIIDLIKAKSLLSQEGF